jgi:rod shape-determining protein MreD
MINSLLKIAVRFMLFVALQVLILNNIHLFRIVTPFLYIYIIVKMPVSTDRIRLIFISFLLGLTVDMFSNTPGMHAAACSLIGFARETLIKLFADRDMTEDALPSFYTFSPRAFIQYVFAIVILHHATLFLIESASFLDPAFLLLRIFSCVFLTAICIFIVEAFHVNRKKDEF